MRVLLAPEAFTGTLSASQAVAALRAGWTRQAPGDELTSLPMSDGGAGLVEVVHGVLGGDLVPVVVPGPEAVPVPATLLLITTAGGVTVWVEAAQVLGRRLVGDPAVAAGTATSAGLGHLLARALEHLDADPRRGIARRVVVGLGPAAPCDGGAGLLAALGAGDAQALDGGGLALADLPDDALAGLDAVRRRFAGLDVVVASADDAPLLGFSGAAAGLAARGVVDAAAAQDLERAVGSLAHVAEGPLAVGRSGTGAPARRPDRPRRLSALAGAGAGGGAGFALTLLGARRGPGPQVVADAVGLAAAVAAADLVVTGEGRLSWRSVRGSVLVALARAAAAAGVPCVSVAGQVDAGRRELLGVGVEAAYPLAQTPAELAAALADPAGTLAARAARVARTWSR